MRVATTEEVWAPVAGFPNYEVSNYGNVFSLKRDRILKPKLATDKHYQIYLGNGIGSQSKYMSIHRLVAQAFVKNLKPNEYTVIDHLDGNPTNNFYLNLEWVTQKENVRRSWANGTSTNIKKNSKQLQCIETEEIFRGYSEAARHFGCDPSAIANVLKGRVGSWHGLHFQYV